MQANLIFTLCGECGHRAQPDEQRINPSPTVWGGFCGACGKYTWVTSVVNFGSPEINATHPREEQETRP